MYCYFDSPIGKLFIESNGKEIIRLDFDTTKTQQENYCKSEVLELCCQELSLYFAGKLQKFSVPIKNEGTLFRQKVWGELEKIPYGKIVSYKDIAVAIDNPKASRAVGMANHHNNIAIIVPCHRVVGSNKKLVGYAGELWRKEFLIELEKADV